MFTGLVQTRGEIAAVTPREEGRTFKIRAALAEGDRVLGASVSVNGVCLTVTASDAQSFTVDAAFESLNKTTLGSLEAGAAVNLEPSLRVGDSLGGHLVSGHVDGVGRLESIERRGGAWECWFSVPHPLKRSVAIKGSICIEGVRLTVTAVEDARFMIGIIPHTLEVTTFGGMNEGTPVNVEVDQLARYVARLIEVERERAATEETGTCTTR